MDHYDALGVPRDADEATIKRAYRKKRSGGAHPDRGGDNQAMIALNIAYENLIDPEKRSYYDSTGQNKPVDSLELQAMQLIIAVMGPLLENAADNLELIVVARNNIQQQIQQFNQQARNIPGLIKKLEQRRPRIKRKGPGVNFIIQSIDAKILDYHQIESKIAEAIRVHDRAYQILEDFSYEVPIQQYAGFGQTFFIGTIS